MSTTALFSLAWGGIIVVALVLDWSGNRLRGRFRPAGDRVKGISGRWNLAKRRRFEQQEAIRKSLIIRYGRPAVSKRRAAGIEAGLLQSLGVPVGTGVARVTNEPEPEEFPMADGVVIDLRDRRAQRDQQTQGDVDPDAGSADSQVEVDLRDTDVDRSQTLTQWAAATARQRQTAARERAQEAATRAREQASIRARERFETARQVAQQRRDSSG